MLIYVLKMNSALTQLQMVEMKVGIK